ncbi:carboxylesterase [Sorangium cellulosum]|uniref:Carboxylesterase n=1 Tax=Sorangium cellulosum TaxID=56 RepID=A0A2L0EWN7_SORCE|nr:prolyl oligopeptidase family serine peptidase [Sorangium cellulosum]AUX43712.1 carboxylesterase [Sorangium cellulosum]
MRRSRFRLPSAWLALALASFAALACERRPAPPAGGIPAGSGPEAPPGAPAASAPGPAAPVASAPAGVEYLEVVTGGADASEALPLVVALHGLGDRPESFAGLLSDADFKARLIVPRGLTPHHDGYSWFPLRQALGGDDVGQGILRAAGALAATIERIAAARPTRGKAIVTGFSQGGALSFALALHHPHAVGAAFPVGGWIPASVLPGARPLDPATPPLVALHGELDRRVPIGPTREAVAALRGLGAKARLESYPDVGHSVSGDMRRDLMRLVRGAIDEMR